MWKLSGGDNKIRQWAELGEFQCISDAARHILKLEGPPFPALFFRVYADPLTPKSDEETLADIGPQLQRQRGDDFEALSKGENREHERAE